MFHEYVHTTSKQMEKNYTPYEINIIIAYYLSTTY